jgi:hypothetical protein
MSMRHRYFGKIAGPGESLGVVPAGPWVALEKIHGAQMLIRARATGSASASARRG